MDKRIVRLLQRNARTPNTEIARALGVTETTIRNRVARLLDDGLIDVVAVVNPDATDATMSAFLDVSLHPSDLNAVVEVLARSERGALPRPHAGPRRGSSSKRSSTTTSTCSTSRPRSSAWLPGVLTVETAIVVRVAKFSYEWEI